MKDYFMCAFLHNALLMTTHKSYPPVIQDSTFVTIGFETVMASSYPVYTI